MGRKNEKAERLFADKDFAAAASVYAQAASAAETAGMLADAGLNWAEAGSCCVEVRDYPKAAQVLERAVRLLLVSDSKPQLIFDVI